jgi:hypothetical protein
MAVLVIPDADSPPDPDFGSSSGVLMTKNLEKSQYKTSLKGSQAPGEASSPPKRIYNSSTSMTSPCGFRSSVKTL